MSSYMLNMLILGTSMCSGILMIGIGFKQKDYILLLVGMLVVVMVTTLTLVIHA